MGCEFGTFIPRSTFRISRFRTNLRFTILPAVIYLRQICMRRFLLVFLWALPLLIAGCKKAESNLTQSTPSPTASAPTSPTPVVQATPTPTPDTNRTAKFMVLLYHRFEDRPAELVTTQNGGKSHSSKERNYYDRRRMELPIFRCVADPERIRLSVHPVYLHAMGGDRR